VLGSALVLGPVGDGLGGVVTTAVGVGTGGSNVNVGDGEPETTADGVTALGSTVTGTALGGSDDSTATGRVAGGDQSTTVPVAGFAALVGAMPMPPAPPGALTAGGAGAGVPSVQPTVTANGRPRATRPKKMGLGDSRT
jgi:hypothetical protein